MSAGGGLLYVFIAVNFVIIARAFTNQAIWLDEAFTLSQIRLPYGQMFTTIANDVHCPLYFIILKFVIDAVHIVLPEANVILTAKFMSVLPVILLVVLSLTKISRNWGKLSGAFFAVCVTSMPQMMHFAVEIRMYSWAMLFVTLTYLYAYDWALSPNKRNWILFTLCAVASFYSHYYGAVSAASIYASLLIWQIIHDKKRIVYCILSGITAVILYTPWLGCAIDRFRRVAIENGFWTGPIDAKRVLFFIMSPFDFGGKVKTSLLFIYIIAVVHFVVNKDEKDKSDVPRVFAAIASFSVFYFTVAAGCIISWLTHPVFYERYATQALPLVYLSLAILLSRRARIKIAPVIMVLTATVALYANMNSFVVYENWQAGTWKNFMKELRTVKKDDAIVTTQPYLSLVLDYLTDDVPVYRYNANFTPSEPARKGLFPDIGNINSYEQITSAARNVYFMISPKEEDAFLSDTAFLKLRFIGDFYAERDAIKLYALEGSL